MTRKTKIISILSLISFFVIFDLVIFFMFTSVVLPAGSEVMRAKMIEVNNYLPFEENTLIVKKKSDANFEGEKPVIDCATALYPVASAFVHAVYEEDDVECVNSNFTENSKLQLNNTLGAYKRIVDGTSDVGLLAKPSEPQKEYAKENDVELILTPIGYEAFVFLLNKNNPIDSLTVEQVKDIYKGKYKNWSELGGYNKEIIPLQRVENSGSQTTFLSFMGGEETITRSLNIFGSAIGYSFRFYVEDVVANGDAKMIALNDIYPSIENIQNKAYPIVSPFYAVTSSKNTNPNVQKLLDWILSEDGQQIIDETGYVRYN